MNEDVEGRRMERRNAKAGRERGRWDAGSRDERED